MPEPSIAKVTIAHVSHATSIFSPTPQVINQFDSVFWVNKTSEAHQPAPDGGTADQWVSQPIQPNNESPQVVFDTLPAGQKSASFPYHCAKHPTNAAEKGVITVNAQS